MMKTIQYKSDCGNHISHVCDVICQMAINKNCNVESDFNGIKLVATPQSTNDSIYKEWKVKIDKSREDYANSPEGIKAENDRKESLNKSQKEVDFLLKVIYGSKNFETDFLMHWLKQFAEIADHIGLNIDYAKLLKWFEDNDFVHNYGLNQPKEFYQNKNCFARYIIGQCMDNFHSNMPPHPVCVRFINDYFKLKD